MLKTTLIIFFAILAGYFGGRLQSPHSTESVETEKAKAVDKPLAQDRAIASEVKTQKLPREYRPRVERRISKDYIKARMKRLKQYSPAEFAEADALANEIQTE